MHPSQSWCGSREQASPTFLPSSYARQWFAALVTAGTRDTGAAWSFNSALATCSISVIATKWGRTSSSRARLEPVAQAILHCHRGLQKHPTRTGSGVQASAADHRVFFFWTALVPCRLLPIALAALSSNLLSSRAVASQTQHGHGAVSATCRLCYRSRRFLRKNNQTHCS